MYMINKQKSILDARLSAVSSLVFGDFVADIGTDHGYLPIALVSSGKISRAVASDIRRGPLERARKNIAAAGLSDKIETRLCDGLRGIEEFPVSDIVIAGMGGLTVIDILAAADFIKDKRTHLVLQPVQHEGELTVYLAENGFFTDKEALVLDDGRVYRVISAAYDGTRRTASPLDAMLGAYNVAHKREYPEAFRALCEKREKLLRAKILGNKKAGNDTKFEEELLQMIEKERSEV